MIIPLTTKTSGRPYLFAKQHLLPSTRWLWDGLQSHGNYSSLYLAGKDYSTINPKEWALSAEGTPSDILLSKTHNASIEKLVVLDEGGGLHDILPEHLANCTVGVEQTTFGMRENWKYPVVLVCRSAAKLIFEAQIISRGILRKLDSLNLLEDKIIGIIGLGAIGSELARSLRLRGLKILGVEPASTPQDLVDISTDIDDLMRRSEIILGCVGANTIPINKVKKLRGEKIFISCSSSNIEFLSLLQHLPKTRRFENVSGMIGNTKCTVLNGGYPINFDRQREWELFEEIILTRKLILAGLKQSMSYFGQPGRGIMLDPQTQMKIVEEWIAQVPQPETLRIPKNISVDFFREHSEGELLCPTL